MRKRHQEPSKESLEEMPKCIERKNWAAWAKRIERKNWAAFELKQKSRIVAIGKHADYCDCSTKARWVILLGGEVHRHRRTKEIAMRHASILRRAVRAMVV